MGAWVDTFGDFWVKRRKIARVLRDTQEATEFQWNWPANRQDNSICIEQCNDPFTNKPLNYIQGIHLIAEALETYRETDWNFKPQGTFDSATFEVYLLDPRSRAQRIYVKIAVMENAKVRNKTTGDFFPDLRIRVKLWSFHPPRK